MTLQPRQQASQSCKIPTRQSQAAHMAHGTVRPMWRLLRQRVRAWCACSGQQPLPLPHTAMHGLWRRTAGKLYTCHPSPARQDIKKCEEVPALLERPRGDRGRAAAAAADRALKGAASGPTATAADAHLGAPEGHRETCPAGRWGPLIWGALAVPTRAWPGQRGVGTPERLQKMREWPRA